MEDNWHSDMNSSASCLLYQKSIRNVISNLLRGGLEKSLHGGTKTCLKNELAFGRWEDDGGELQEQCV